MLDRLIQYSIKNRLVVLAVAALLLVYGLFTIAHLPVDVLPDLNRPRVTIFLEANGMAPEEIETQVNLPVETALNGATGVEVVRSIASPGLGMIFVEFDWDTDVLKARQLTSEKLQTVELPKGITPVMGPISSIMGQILLIAVTADTTSPIELRTLADYTIRRRLMSVKGVSQVIPIGGERMQYQVLLDPDRLRQYQISVKEVSKALESNNLNTTGGFINDRGSEVLIRNVARAYTLEDIEGIVVRNKDAQPVFLKQVADVRIGGPLKRGDGSINGKPAVILSIEKQPAANTIDLTRDLQHALDEIGSSLPQDVKLHDDVFQQKNFIVNSITNVEHALRDGFILVVIILFLFLLNVRTTIITLTAIPLSLILTSIIFKFFGVTINTLTLGGLAIAIGELVDDAIVDVENVYRRLKENWELPEPRPVHKVIFEASSEVRNSIVYATIVVVLVFIPLFYLQGIEGRIFTPLGIAYITSIAASLFVSLTVTPALCSFLLGRKKHLRHVRLSLTGKKGTSHNSEEDSPLVKFLKRKDRKLLEWGLGRPRLIIGLAGLLIVVSIFIIPFFGTEFLPPFNEGSYTVNLIAPAGTSLEESNKIGALAEKQMLKVPEVILTARRTGRAELDEHAEPPSYTEIEVPVRASDRSRSAVLADLRKQLSVLKGVSVNIGQPISHRLDHLLSGVRAQVAIKVFGNDLSELRSYAGQIKKVLESVHGATDVQVENQVMTPQLSISVDRRAMARFGLQAGEVAEELEVFYNGLVTGEIIDGQKSFDIALRVADSSRNDIESIKNTPISLPEGGYVPLHMIAKVELTKSINSIYHENTLRRIVVSANIQNRDLGSAVKEMQEAVKKEVHFSPGYYIKWGGQFESQQSATNLILLLSLFSVAGIFLVLYSHFKSTTIVLQVMLNIPLALVGSVIAVALTGGTFSVATLVGFITLTGIASRNGIMMISHYIHLVKYEGENFGKKMIIRGSLERLVPVLMTALVAALALIPLTLDPSAAGKEILYPVATVILGGLISSTILDIIVTPVVFSKFGMRAIKKLHSKVEKVHTE